MVASGEIAVSTGRLFNNDGRINVIVHKGAKVRVYQNSITCDELEGDAVVTSILRPNGWSDVRGRPVWRVKVRFPKDPVSYQRDVSEILA